MIVLRFRIALGCIGLLLANVSAQQPASPPAFRFERSVAPNGQGPRRLAIDVPLLAGGNPFRSFSRHRDPATGEVSSVADGGLTDLRLFDASGRDVGYLLVAKPPLEPAWKAATILAVAPVETEKVKSSGFEADLGDAYLVDRFRADGIRPPFLKRVRLEGSGDRAHWTLVVAEGTVFDLPDEKLRQTTLAFTPGSFRYVRLTWDDSHSGRVALPAMAVARVVAAAVPPPPLTSAAIVERRPSEPRRSRYRIRLPGGHLPVAAIELDLAGGHVLREAAVYEARLAGAEVVPVMLGSATLRRVVQGPLTASSLQVPIAPPSEAQLDLVVDDGDNPPLEVRGATAIFADLPWIYFESDGSALAARYGNPSLAAPRYDLEAVRATLRIDSIADATWGDPRARATEENAGAAPSLPNVGAPLDPALFGYLRAVPPGEAGLVALPLDAAVLAHSAGEGARFADVRVIDAAGRQVPYLVERSSEPLSLDLRVERLSAAPKTLQPRRGTPPSVHRIAWPYERLPSPRLVLTTPARVFQRSISVAVDRDADQRHRDRWIETLATTVWVHADQDKPTPALIVSLPGVDAKELLVVVEEGDNTPLPIETARVLLPAYRLRLFRDRDASLRLAYGRSDLTPPRYDLALLAPQLMGVPATEVVPGAEQRTQESAIVSLVSPRLFWIVLGLAVIALLVLIVRLVRKEEANGQP